MKKFVIFAIGFALGGLFGGIGGYVINDLTSRENPEVVQQMQDDARHALRELTFDLSIAGHYADLLVPGSVTPDGGLTLTSDCGPVGSPEWMYQTTEAGTGNWKNIFDGKTFGDWKPNERPQNWTIEDGAIVGRGERSHLYYMGEAHPGGVVKTKIVDTPGSGPVILWAEPTRVPASLRNITEVCRNGVNRFRALRTSPSATGGRCSGVATTAPDGSIRR